MIGHLVQGLGTSIWNIFIKFHQKVSVVCLYLERRDAEAQGSCSFSSQTDTCGYTVQPKWSIEQKFQQFPLTIKTLDNGIPLQNFTQFKKTLTLHVKINVVFCSHALCSGFSAENVLIHHYMCL